MTQSMTGYGRGDHSSDRYQFGIEIRSTNHRFLEVKLRFPRELIAFEGDIRNFVRSRFSRGYFDVQAFLGRPPNSNRRFIVDNDLLAQVAAGLKEAGRLIDKAGEVDLAVLSQFREVFHFEEEPDDVEELGRGLMAAAEGAVAEISASRKREGEEILRAVTEGWQRLEKTVKKMLQLTEPTNAALETNLRKRLAELIDGGTISEERLHQEAAILAVKADVTEELERLKGHLDVFGETLEGEGPRGRKLDFLLQEMHRELNTSAAKAATLELGHLSIEGRLELEKIREQIQNLE